MSPKWMFWPKRGTVESGYLYAVGGTGDGATIRKYDLQGNEITTGWPQNHGASVYHVTIDDDENVYTVGSVSPDNVTTRKYNSEGVLQWTANHGHTVWGVAADDDGNVYTTGNHISPDGQTTRKYNSSGVLQWSVTHGASTRSVTVDKDGLVYITGSRFSPDEMTTRKYNPSGTPLLSFASGLTSHWSVAVDKEGNIYCSGDRVDNTSVRKSNASGVLQWAADDRSTVRAITVDDQLNVYAAGSAGNYARKFNQSGIEVTSGGWPIAGSALAFSVDLDDYGNVYVGSGVNPWPDGPRLKKYTSDGFEVTDGGWPIQTGFDVWGICTRVTS